MSIFWNSNIIEAIREEPRGDKYNEYPATLILIGAGGGGGSGNSNIVGAGGGGAGHYISASFTVNPLGTYDIVVGSPNYTSPPRTDGGNDGGPTIFSSASVELFYALGGGGGENGGSGGPGFDGASGGGASGGPGDSNTSYPGGLSLPVPSGSNFDTTITGSIGGAGRIAVVGPQNVFEVGGGGGGALSGGQKAGPNDAGGDTPGGQGIDNVFLLTLGPSGSNVAAGGTGGGAPQTGQCVTAPGANATTYGSGGGGANGLAVGGQGASGSFAIIYEGIQKGLGGQVSSIGNYTMHFFTASGEFYATGYRHNPA